MDKDRFYKALEDFIDARINDIGESESEALQEKGIKLMECEDRLVEALTPEQMKLWEAFETAYRYLEGETLNEYYRRGVRDGVNLIIRLGGFENE